MRLPLLASISNHGQEVIPECTEYLFSIYMFLETIQIQSWFAKSVCLNQTSLVLEGRAFHNSLLQPILVILQLQFVQWKFNEFGFVLGHRSPEQCGQLVSNTINEPIPDSLEIVIRENKTQKFRNAIYFFN